MESLLYVFYLKVILTAYDADNIKPYGVVNPECFHIGIGGNHYAPDFLRSDRLLWKDIRRIPSGFYFHNNQFMSIGCYNVQFQMSLSPIPVENAIAKFLQIHGRSVLAGLAQCIMMRHYAVFCKITYFML
jgi:hypothetical protein